MNTSSKCVTEACKPVSAFYYIEAGNCDLQMECSNIAAAGDDLERYMSAINTSQDCATCVLGIGYEWRQKEIEIEAEAEDACTQDKCPELIGMYYTSPGCDLTADGILPEESTSNQGFVSGWATRATQCATNNGDFTATATGVIIGASLGGTIVLVSAILVAVFCIIRCCRRKRNNGNSNGPNADIDDMHVASSDSDNIPMENRSSIARGNGDAETTDNIYSDVAEDTYASPQHHNAAGDVPQEPISSVGHKSDLYYETFATPHHHNATEDVYATPQRDGTSDTVDSGIESMYDDTVPHTKTESIYDDTVAE